MVDCMNAKNRKKEGNKGMYNFTPHLFLLHLHVVAGEYSGAAAYAASPTKC